MHVLNEKTWYSQIALYMKNTIKLAFRSSNNFTMLANSLLPVAVKMTYEH